MCQIVNYDFFSIECTEIGVFPACVRRTNRSCALTTLEVNPLLHRIHCSVNAKHILGNITENIRGCKQNIIDFFGLSRIFTDMGTSTLPVNGCKYKVMLATYDLSSLFYSYQT